MYLRQGSTSMTRLRAAATYQQMSLVAWVWMGILQTPVRALMTLVICLVHSRLTQLACRSDMKVRL